MCLMKGFCCQFDSKSDRTVALSEAIKMASLFFQCKLQLNDDYHQEFRNKVEALESYTGVGTIAYILVLIKVMLRLITESKWGTDESVEVLAKASTRSFFGSYDVLGVNAALFQAVQNELVHDFKHISFSNI